MPFRLAMSALVLALVAALPGDTAAQTAQRFSIQLSALGVQLTGEPNEDLAFGGGGELQVRWNPSAFSIGIGGQTTRHELDRVGITFKGGFIEPRYILTAIGESVGLYASGRLMTLDATFEAAGFERKIEGFAVSGGGGLLIRLGGRLNLELGVTAGKEYYKNQITDGYQASGGATVVTRLGLAIGLG